MNEVATIQIDEAQLRTLLKQEISRLKEGKIAPEDIDDDEPLFSITGEFESRIELDSLDALELAFALEQATGTKQPEEWDYRDLVSVARVLAYARTSASQSGGGR